jgi:hypothetical protein
MGPVLTHGVEKPESQSRMLIVALYVEFLELGGVSVHLGERAMRRRDTEIRSTSSSDRPTIIMLRLLPKDLGHGIWLDDHNRRRVKVADMDHESPLDDVGLEGRGFLQHRQRRAARH